MRLFRFSGSLGFAVLALCSVIFLAFSAQRSGASEQTLDESDGRQIILQTLPAIAPLLVNTATPTQSLMQVNPELIAPLQIATATRTPTPINLGNFVWDDIDHDGRQDNGEPGLAGVTVQLWNSAKTQMIAQTTTNASGIYSVIAPLPGQYRIRVLLSASANDTFSPKDQAGGDNTLDSDINAGGANAGFTDVINIANNVISMTNIDAGIIKFRTPTPTRTPTPINLGNFVWDDIDHDGRQDNGEPGLAGVTVQLWNSAKTQMIAQTTTNASGNYSVIAPLPGQYRIRVLLPSPMDTFSPKNQAGGDDTDDSDINVGGANAGFTDVINIASNVISITNLDMGIIKFRTPTPTRTPTPINLGNLVWDDLNENGRQDEGEPGLAGVTVQLWNSAKTQLIAQTTTNASGIYSVIAPLPGQYRIRVVLASSSHSFAPKDQAGGDDTKDSDINAGGANAGFTDVINIASNVISMTNIDAGVLTPLTVFQVPAEIMIPAGATNTPSINVIAPPVTLNVCAGFRLTSPLDGLPNGVATFYWDPASVAAIYQIIVMNESRGVLASATIQDSTSMVLDVSQGAIGGGYQLIVQINALVNGQVACSDEHLILRAAPQISVPPEIRQPIIPTATTPRRGG